MVRDIEALLEIVTSSRDNFTYLHDIYDLHDNFTKLHDNFTKVIDIPRPALYVA
jgi:hypothetical protein